MSVSRRDVLKFAAATPGVLGLGVVASSLRAAPASAGSLGTLLDYAAGVIPASQIRAAGGPTSAPIYASIDDNPSYEQYKNQIVPYLRSWESVIGHQRTGVYANSKTIDWAVNDGLGSYFWQHNWGSPKGYTHPAAHLHQVEIDKRKVGGVGVDVNQILKPQFGQWA